MGNGASLTLIPVKPGFSTMSITFQLSDRITVLHLDDAGLSVIRQAIKESWPQGITLEQSRCGTGWSFKLCGNPFGWCKSSDGTEQARKMVCQILQRLYSIGWKVVSWSNLGREEVRTTLFFKRFPSQFSTQPFVCMSLNDSDKLRFINISSELLQPIKEAIKRSWSPGIQKEDLRNGALEIKLCGNPWTCDKQAVMARQLLQDIIATFHRYQWTYTCSINFTIADLQSMIFHYDPSIPRAEALTLCSINLTKGDRLRLINASPETINMVRETIKTHWKPGEIQEERDFHGSWEFKLLGWPWSCTKKESVRARYLIVKILESMQEHGWLNIAGIHCSNRPDDKSTLIFQKIQPKQSPMMCLALNNIDLIRLINVPPSMSKVLKDEIVCRWAKHVQAEKQIDNLAFGSVCELKLVGCPWRGGYNDNTLHGISLLCHIIEEFWKNGWKPLFSGDISSKYLDDENKIRVDPYSMWFVYDSTLSSVEPSAPTYKVMPPPPPYVSGFQFADLSPPSYTEATEWK